MPRLLVSTPFCFSLGLLLTSAFTQSHAAIVTIGDFSTPSSSVSRVGSVDIFLENDGSLPINLAAYQLKVTLLGGDAESVITSFGAPSGRPYVFSGASSGPLGLITMGSKVVELGDFLNSGSRSVVGGEGLASLQFSIPANSTKDFRLDLSLDPQDTFLSDGGVQFFPFTFRGGAISITAVPEPSVSAMLVFAPLMYLWINRRGKRGDLATKSSVG